MMQPIAEYTVNAVPDRGLIEVYDADAYMADAAAMKASRQQVVAGNGYHLYLHSLQSEIAVEVHVRIWASEEKIPDHAEGSTSVSIESETGILVIGQLTFGPAGEMELPEAGVYEGVAWWTGRQPVAEYRDSILSQIGDDWSVDQITRKWKECPASESYFLDLMFSRASEVDEL
ncbi:MULTISPECIES: hypothetical protein [unclassified Streptomyces]|uniref:hypothetical protein n=1 Tax=unclassified Streptomyces TaxID=2593676 RepID=UPI001F0BB5A7|nr:MULTISPECIES: hypothetical protein [unclassified Streptomyces]